MMKWIKRLLILVLAASVVTGGAGLLRDQETLEEGLLRLHVVANSDAPEDQAVKLRVKDAVVSMLEETMEAMPTVEEAKAYLETHLPQIEETANRVLKELGSGLEAVVTFARERFPTREYDTFRLPAGVYQALRITIGAGEGHNWWCVLFPSLCVPASTQGFTAAAEASGMSQTLAGTLAGDTTGYEIRFRLLDWLGEVKASFAP
ncbi:MAG: stage II sporulation protein R [Candidatus Faecousia sp.]|nr:stage II sporulation protein R [Bacillota bacterium]MDY4220634.1 stage II sporulation protein R [Candidatus Faecousia sp.]